MATEISNNRRTVLHHSELFEVVSIEWTSNSVPVLHDHGWSQCAVLVEEGVFENFLDFGVKTETHTFHAGQALSTPVGAKHSMRCVTPQGKTLHVYTPKIKEITNAGVFRASNHAELEKGLRLNQATDYESLKKLLDLIRAESISTHSPYFMNQLFSGVLPQMLLAQELISQTKTTLATYEASSVFSNIEEEVVESLGELIGWPHKGRDGVAVPGGSAANFMAIHCARQRKFPESKEKGLEGKRLKIFVSTEAHYSLKKACAALGLGTESLVYVPTDSKGRMSPSHLEELISKESAQGAIPLLVCATAGTTVLGAFDPVDELAKICKKHDMWLHVDGAWGGPALFSKRLRPLLRGIDQADSLTFDAHKLLGANLTSSFFLTTHAGLLLEANDVSGGDYLFHANEAKQDRGKLSWQCGRQADAVSFWTIWKSLGNEGIGSFVDRLLDVRDQTLEWAKSQERLKLVDDPSYLNLCLKVLPPHPSEKTADWSRKVRESLKEKNLAMVNYSENSDGCFLRLILAHPYLEFKHLKQILAWALAVE